MCRQQKSPTLDRTTYLKLLGRSQTPSQGSNGVRVGENAGAMRAEKSFSGDFSFSEEMYPGGASVGETVQACRWPSRAGELATSDAIATLGLWT